MRLGGQVNDTINLVFSNHLAYKLNITDITLYKLVVSHPLNISEILKVPGISEQVQVKNIVLGIFVDHQPNQM
ncbi:hypothetical protein SDC9_41844 [bioreactor metagenome]|uniref:Uncharacterized protein n=1 Tax=bioreactor metagenome TaxID=1076179 RepID=A0A644VYX5_9ZZZZ